MASMTVLINSIGVFKKPDNTSELLETLKKGDKFNSVEKRSIGDDTWFQRDKGGWIRGAHKGEFFIEDSVEGEPYKATLIVTANSLGVFKEASNKSTMTGNVVKGDKINVVEKKVVGDETWYKMYGGGWVRGIYQGNEYLEDANKPIKTVSMTITAKDGLIVREGPSTTSKDTGKRVKNGDVVKVIGKKIVGDERWYQLEDGNWICGYQKGSWYLKDTPTENNKTNLNGTNGPNTNQGKDYGKGHAVGEGGVVTGTGITPSSTNVGIDFGKMVMTEKANLDEDYTIDTSWLNYYIEIIKRNHNIYVNGQDNLMRDHFEYFNRYKQEYPDMALDKTFAYVFMTRPDLNIFDSTSKTSELHEQVANDPHCYYMHKTRPEILTSLSLNHSTEHHFNTFLSNKINSFEVSDEFIKTGEMGETFTGHKISFGKSNIESRTAGTFNIQYVDDKELNVMKMHKIWVDYISNVYRGVWNPKRDYIINKVLDYAVSVYYILVGGDGETILFWSKYIGVYPTNIPTSTLSYSKGSMVQMPEYSITYQYSIKEDFNPIALAEFNMNSKSDSYVYSKTYEPTLMSTGRSFCGAPFIHTVKENGEYKYKLRFRKADNMESQVIVSEKQDNVIVSDTFSDTILKK